MMSPIQSFGAAQTVTGSCHLLALRNGPKILIDCGLFQGLQENRSAEHFGFDPQQIDVVILTHAHLDHVGRLPKLVKEGFDGRLIATRPTMELAEVVLIDSAKIMEEDFATAYKKAQRRGDEKRVKAPLYDLDDAHAVFDLNIQYADYGKAITIGRDVSVTFYNAGHILGSASVKIDFIEEGQPKSVVFSGDLGNRRDLLMPAPQIPPKADALYIESTYGDRNHRSLEESIAEFRDAIQTTLARQGNVMIPSFAIERTQEILLLLKQLYYAKELPPCQVFVDSPMAIRATQIYNQHATELNQNAQAMLQKDGSIFDFPGLHFSSSAEESMRINNLDNGCIIIAGSGMCHGGRILHHFKHRLWNERNAVLFVGYQAEGTLGRKLVDGADEITLYHEPIKVRARIHMINGFSAHADQAEMLHWMSQFQSLGKVFLVHGELDKQQIFKRAIEEKLGKTTHIVEYGEKVWV